MAMAEESEKGTSTSSKPGEEMSWGTLQELLLACAVVRHGTNSWDSIAREVQKPSILRNRDNKNNQNSHNNLFFSPLNCQRKYHDLRRRFNVDVDADDEPPAAADKSATAEERGVREMADELRKLRVEELRREVQRHDNSIVSLELKVKKLEEERENSLKIKTENNDNDEGGGQAGGLNSDLRIKPDRDGGARLNTDRSCNEIAVKSVSGERSDEREDGSFNESNSMGHRGDNNNNNKAAKESDEPNRNSKPDPVLSQSGVIIEHVKHTSSSGGGGPLEGSECGKETVLEKETSSRPQSRVESDSVSESKREEDRKEEAVREEGSKQQQQQHSSDVQSSASLSKRRRRRRGWREGAAGGGDGNSSGDEMEAEEELSPANKKMSVKSQPLIKLMEILSSHKHGLVFQRRLPSQESEKYRNLIRQHMDLEMVQSKLDRGVYSDCNRKFYRDLLLIFTNAILFFRKSSAEHMAARELRKFISKEVAQRLSRQQHRFKPAVVAAAVKTDVREQVVKKPRSTSTIVVCRRRSSLKPLSSSDQKNSSGQKKESMSDGKTQSNTTAKETPTSSSTSDQRRPSRKGGGEDGGIKTEKSSLGSSRKGGGEDGGGIKTEKSSLGSSVGRNSGVDENKKVVVNRKSSSNNKKEEMMMNSDEDDDDDQPLSMKAKQLAAAAAASKKQGVVNFLKRMKQNSPSPKAKDNISEEEEGDEEEGKRKRSSDDINKKKGNVGKSEEKREPRRTSGRKSAGSEEKESRDRTGTKRGVGRPVRTKPDDSGRLPVRTKTGDDSRKLPVRTKTPERTKTGDDSGRLPVRTKTGTPDDSGRLTKKRSSEKDAGDSGRPPKKKPRR